MLQASQSSLVVSRSAEEGQAAPAARAAQIPRDGQVSDAGAEPAEEDPVELVMRALKLTESDRANAVAIVEGQYLLQNPFDRYWSAVPNGCDVAAFMASWFSWDGALCPPHERLGALAADAYPYLWARRGADVAFPRITCVALSALVEMPVREEDSFASTLERRFLEALARERDVVAPTLRRTVASKPGKETEAIEAYLANMTSLAVTGVPHLWGPEPSVGAKPSYWRWRDFDHLTAAVPPEWRARLWREFERTMAMAVALRSRHKPGERHDTAASAVRAAEFWRSGNFPFALAGFGCEQTLFVLVKSLDAN